MNKRICEVSGELFALDGSDLAHYEKNQLPLPKLCPQERLRRRLAWRNDRSFYRRSCSLCNKSMVAIYPQETRFPVYCPSCWWGDGWDGLRFGRKPNGNQSFFEQFGELMKLVPRLGMDLVNCENSDFCNYCGDDKNCYFDIAGEANEDCYFNLFTKYSKNCVDNTFVYHSTLCYESLHCHNCYHVFFALYCSESSDLYFCHDLRGCHNCCFCTNLRNRSYCIENQQYPKELYFTKLKELKLHSFSNLNSSLQKWRVLLEEQSIHRDMFLTNTENCSGDNISNSKNTEYSYNATNCEDCRYLYDVLDARNCYDLNYSLYNPQYSTELISTLQMHSCAFCVASHFSSNLHYCDMCNHSQDLFGCIGLRHQQNCILNYQYSASEYQDIKSKLIKEMESRGEWGEFFPANLSPHAYNETVAQEYLPLTREQALVRAMYWKDKDGREYQPSSAILNDDVNEVSDSILKQVLSCTKCSRNYRIITQELRFYREQQLPLPRLCPECRHLRRNELRNPRKLFSRNCSRCSKKILTTFENQQINQLKKIYCQQCYLECVY